MTDKLDKKIKDELNPYIVQYPDEIDINTTIDSLRQYIPPKHSKGSYFNQRFIRLINHAKTEVFFMGKAYWLISIALFIIGYFITISRAFDPIITLVFLAPIPFVFGLIEVFKSRDQGLLEMEMACKFSAHEVMLARLLLVSLFNLTLNTLLTLAFSPYIATTTLLHVTMLWLTPFTLFTALLLWISMKVRSTTLSLAIIPLWGFFTFSIHTDVKWQPLVFDMHIAVHLILMGIGIGLFIIQIKQLINKYSVYEEVGTVEISY